MDFMILVALSLVLGLAVLCLLYWSIQYGIAAQPSVLADKKADSTVGKSVPRWDLTPSDSEKGDLDELTKHGSLHQYLLHLHNHGHQPITSFYWGQQRVVSVCSPEMIKDTTKLTNRPKLLFALFEPILGSHSIQYANGPEWEERRQWLYKSLRDENLKSYVPIFVQIANETADSWSQLGSDAVVELQEDFMTMTIKGITRTCYGSIFSDDKEIRILANIYHKLWDEMEQSLHIGPPDPGSTRDKELKGYIEQIKNKISKVISNRQNGTETDNIPFIDSLLQSGVPEEQIVADGVTFMIGGMHTSGYLMVWSVHYLSLNQDIHRKLVEEMGNRVGEDRGAKLMEYVYDTDSLLRQVLNETLRLSVLAPYAARYSDDDLTLGGYHVPAGTPVVVALGVALKNQNMETS